MDPRGYELVRMVNLQRYQNWLAREVVSVLEAAYREIGIALLTQRTTLTATGLAQRQALFARIDRTLQRAYREVDALTRGQLGGLVEAESALTVQHLRDIVGGRARVAVSFDVLSAERAGAIARLPIDGLNIGEWWERQAQTMTFDVRRAIQVGITNGEPVPAIARRVWMADTSRSPEPMAWRRARRDAVTTVRTSVTAVSSEAAIETYKAQGEGIVERYRLLVTRDARTSVICQQHAADADAGVTYPVGDARSPRPPFHPNCRSTTMPVIEYAKLGLPEPSRDGPLGFPDYGRWLSQQSATTQNQLLGRGRVDLWRSGRVSLRDLVDQDGRVFTLEQLRQRNGI
jgi:SPP1 gp7 family putative phage head morphogenesis protein